MRDIIFRGIGIKSREWVYGAYIPAMDEDSCDSIIDEQGEQHIVFSDTVGQYTGLKEKNGKKIFEGDIFKDYSGIFRSVFRVPGGLAFEDNPVSFGYDHRAPVYPYSSIAEMQNASWLSRYCEIIGNIHDHPDLLK